MHQWDPLCERDVAPSPIVPTYRRGPSPSKRKQSSMTSPAESIPAESIRPRDDNASRPQARSAGMAERPTRNESLVDLVRFFQTQGMPTTLNMPPDTTTATSTTTTALPPAELKEPKDIKPLHRRLLQFTQRQKKDAPPKPKVSDQQRQIEALQREGYLLGTPPPKSKGNPGGSLSKSKKQDVENIGQPWLESKGEDFQRPGDTSRRRLASLDLGDFGSMVDVAVSLSSDYDDPAPPPYRPATQATASQADQDVSSRSSIVSSKAQATAPQAEQSQRPTSSADSSIRIVSDSGTAPQATADPPAVASAIQTPKKSANSDQQKDKDSNGRSETPNHSPSQSTPSPAQPVLKLFPDVAPPRVSSRNAWRLSSVPRYQIAPSIASSNGSDARGETSETPTESADGTRDPSGASSSDSQSHRKEPQCSGALLPTAPSVESKSPGKAPQEVSVRGDSKPRPPSLSPSTLKAFPLPAPTKPLPCLPESGRAPSAPPDANPHATIRKVRSGLRASVLPSSVVFPEEHSHKATVKHPHGLAVRPATALGNVESEEPVDEDSKKSPTKSSNNSKLVSPGQHTPTRRAASVRVSRMQELPGSPSDKYRKPSDQAPLVESPVLGHASPVKPSGKRAVRQDLHINSQRSTFWSPIAASNGDSPGPPLQAPSGRLGGQRDCTAPTGSMVPSIRNIDSSFGSGSYRSSIISRSNSSRSSLRHENIPESYQPSRSESPLPSSDDEGFGPGMDSTRPGRTVDTHHRTRIARRAHEAVEARKKPGPDRLRLPHPPRPLTPQNRSSQNLEKPSSPQSLYSQFTYRSRDSQSSYRPHLSQSQAPNYLEDRVANLERQNQILQAALLAALNAGAKPNLGDLHPDSALSPQFPSAAPPNHYPGRFGPRPESWVSSSRSSEHGGLETPSSYREGRVNAPQLDHMVEDTESGWMSDKSSLSGARCVRHA
ncbi:hypothetical protein NUU61_007499 [Penicillium alfredii]|uniref:Uncharacterized protein n=1 Tax=Penicillium alfredii TaxID=1506179 RepID=A0A9W9F324_9EURO|nr:uncharacterized protein NUU61_007499 [Penicillium alfredii]KAJ5092629.1 hypothetical protein NUU61_007499 [Penicillium alfredii]